MTLTLQYRTIILIISNIWCFKLGLIRDLNELVKNDVAANVYDEYALKLLNRIECLRGDFFNDGKNPSVESYLCKINDLSHLYADAYILKEIVPLTNCYKSLILKEFDWFKSESNSHSDYVSMNASCASRNYILKGYGQDISRCLININNNSEASLRLIKEIFIDLQFNKNTTPHNNDKNYLNLFFKLIIKDVLNSFKFDSEYKEISIELVKTLDLLVFEEKEKRVYILDTIKKLNNFNNTDDFNIILKTEICEEDYLKIDKDILDIVKSIKIKNISLCEMIKTLPHFYIGYIMRNQDFKNAFDLFVELKFSSNVEIIESVFMKDFELNPNYNYIESLDKYIKDKYIKKHALEFNLNNHKLPLYEIPLYEIFPFCEIKLYNEKQKKGIIYSFKVYHLMGFYTLQNKIVN